MNRLFTLCLGLLIGACLGGLVLPAPERPADKDPEPAPQAPASPAPEPPRMWARGEITDVRVVSVKEKRFSTLDRLGFKAGREDIYSIGLCGVLPAPAKEAAGIEMDTARTDTDEDLLAGAPAGAWVTLSADGTRIYWEKDLRLPSRQAAYIARLAGRLKVHTAVELEERAFGTLATADLEGLEVAKWYTARVKPGAAKVFETGAGQLLLRLGCDIGKAKAIHLRGADGEPLRAAMPQRGGGRSHGSYVLVEFPEGARPKTISPVLVFPGKSTSVSYTFETGAIPIQARLGAELPPPREIDIF